MTPRPAKIRAVSRAVVAARQAFPPSVYGYDREHVERITRERVEGAFAAPSWWTLVHGPDVLGFPCEVMFWREGAKLVVVPGLSFADAAGTSDDRGPPGLHLETPSDIDLIASTLDEMGNEHLATCMLIWLQLGLREVLTMELNKPKVTA